MLFVAYIVKFILAVLYFVRSTLDMKPYGAVPGWMKEMEMLQPALFDTANCCIVIGELIQPFILLLIMHGFSLACEGISL